METLTYTFRPSLLSKEETFSLDGKTLGVSGRVPVAFSDIHKIRTYDSPGLKLMGGAPLAPSSKRCVVHPKSGHAIVLSTSHFLAAGSFEDRSATYKPFVDALIRNVSAANPATVFIGGMPMALWVTWIAIVVMALLLVPLMVLVVIGSFISGHALSPGVIFPALLLVSIVIGIRPLWRTITRGRPRRYDPRADAAAAS